MTAKRGRPRSLPQECLADLVNLLHDARQRGCSLNATCRYIIANGGVKWIHNKTGKTVHEITNQDSLRSRLIEAENWYLSLKRALDTVKHPRAAEFGVLPVIKFGMTVYRRQRPLPPRIARILGRRTAKQRMLILRPPPKRTTHCLVGKKSLHSAAQKVAQ